MMLTTTDLTLLFSDELIALIMYVFLYLTYYFASDFAIIKKYSSRFNESEENLEKSVYLRRIIGFILLGIIPLIIALFFFDENLGAYGLGLPAGKFWILWFLIPTGLITVGSIFRSNKTIDSTYYPEVRKEIWTRKRLALNIIFWTLYLLGYEFALRGVIFFTSVYAWGLWPAIIINSVIYSLIHIFKGKQEAFGAFFLGILFCLITFYTNSFWFAFIDHVILAVINDVKAVQSSTSMRFQFRKLDVKN